MRHPYGGTTAYPVPGRFLLSFGPYGCVLRLGDGSLAGREETVGVGCTAAGRSDRFLADVSLCPLPDGHHRRCTGGRRLRMDRGEAGGNVLAEELCKE